jgi:hypothetical protein
VYKDKLMKPYLILYLILFAASALSQDKGIISELPARHFQLKNSIDTIDFILLNGKIDKMKPVLIFCQGSNPLPLITID